MDVMNKPTKWILAATGTTVVLMVGVGIGAAGSTTDRAPRSADLSAPTVTVTKTVPNVASRMTPATPQVCVDALDDAEVIYGDAGDFLQIFTEMAPINSRAVTAAYNHDILAMQAATAEIKAKTAGIRRITMAVSAHGASYRVAARQCRAGA
jgi:hypothetical protein